jgi:hypothetical protein
MANVSSPYGLRPVNLIGGQVFAGQFREFKLSTDNSYGFFNGDIVQLTSAGNPQTLAVGNASPTAIQIPATSANATAGIVGVCVGVRYVTPTLNQPQFAQFLPASAISAGYTDVFIRVLDDPDALFYVQGSAAFGSLTNGGYGAIGKNAALQTFRSGSTTTGNSAMSLVVGTNGGSLAATTTLAMRVVDVARESITDTYPDLIVKFNLGVHSYYNPLGV